MYPNLGDPESLEVVVHCDATHASLPSGGSQGAQIVFVCGNGKVAPITWRSKKLNRITKSPIASETMALAEAADSAFLVSSMVQEIFGLKKRPDVICKTENLSLQKHLESSRVIQDLRLRVDIARLREMITLKEIRVEWIGKSGQLADVMTKAGASSSLLMSVLKHGTF